MKRRDIQNLLASLRNLPEDESPSIDRGPKGLDSVLEVLEETHALGDYTPEKAIMDNWAQIIGEAHAACCSPEKLDTSGTLLVRVVNPILRRELQFHKRKILQNIQATKGCSKVRNIQLIAG